MADAIDNPEPGTADEVIDALGALSPLPASVDQASGAAALRALAIVAEEARTFQAMLLLKGGAQPHPFVRLAVRVAAIVEGKARIMSLEYQAEIGRQAQAHEAGHG